MIVAIYTIRNLASGKVYVGISSRLKARWRAHKNGATTSSRHLTNSIKKHGVENFEFSHIADALTFDDAHAVERALIVEYNCKSPNGYNLTDGGEGAPGHVPSAETRRKVSLAHKGKKLSEETKRRVSAGRMGQKHAPEVYIRIGMKQRGKQFSPEHIEKLRISSTGRKRTEESKARMSEKMKGRVVWWGDKTSAAQRGRKRPPEAVEKQRQKMLGRTQTPEQVALRMATKRQTIAMKKIGADRRQIMQLGAHHLESAGFR